MENEQLEQPSASIVSIVHVFVKKDTKRQRVRGDNWLPEAVEASDRISIHFLFGHANHTVLVHRALDAFDFSYRISNKSI